jgi:hypothetical protein
MEVTLQPDHANARIEQVGDWKVYHTTMIPRRTLTTHEPTQNQLFCEVIRT